MDWGIEFLVGKKFIEELKKFPDCGKLVKKINKPVLFITAGNKKGNFTAGIKYFKHANQPKKLIKFASADHNFNKLKDERRLLEGTYLWLKNVK